MTKPICVMTGPPGAGKTTTGLAVATLLDVPFRDTDGDIEEAAGKPIPEIFIDEGEAYFRALESAAVATALSTFDGVLALGAGAILAEHNREALRGHVVVHLQTGFAEALHRIGLGAGRPLLAVNPRATLKHLLEQRLPLYQAVATITVVTDGRKPEELAEDIVSRL
ncbi:MAG TPA: shikimate kinase [Asanoa sp.]|jgi:shikimate kinase